MTRLVRAELQKLSTVWSSYTLVGVTALISALLGLAIGLAPHRRALSAGVLLPAHGSVPWFDEVFSATVIALDFALVLGVLLVTGEHRHKTITPSYLAEPRRGRVTAAKLVTSAIAGAVVGLAADLGGLALGAVFVAFGNGSWSEMLTRYGHVAPGVVAGAVLFGMYGAGLGSLLRNQVVALVVGLGVTAVVEPIIVGVWSSAGRWLPSQAARSLESVTASTTTNTGLGGGLTHLLPSWEAATVLLGYAILLAAAGSLTTLRADVT